MADDDWSVPPRSLEELARRFAAFAAARDWEQFHAPKNLAMALVAEAGELVAEFQWLSETASRTPDAERLARIRAEAADVLIYLVRLADQLQFDLLEAAAEKMAVNERRYPAERFRGSARKYNED